MGLLTKKEIIDYAENFCKYQKEFKMIMNEFGSVEESKEIDLNVLFNMAERLGKVMKAQPHYHVSEIKTSKSPVPLEDIIIRVKFSN